MEQVFTSEQIENRLDKLSMELSDLTCEKYDTQRDELTRIRDEISTLVIHLEKIPAGDMKVILDVDQDKVDHFSTFCSELITELTEEEEVMRTNLGFDFELDDVIWTLEPEAVVAEGSWNNINDDNGYFTINDLAFFGELSIE